MNQLSWNGIDGRINEINEMFDSIADHVSYRSRAWGGIPLGAGIPGQGRLTMWYAQS